MSFDSRRIIRLPLLRHVVQTVALVVAAVLAPIAPVQAQERGAAELARLIDGLGVSARVLMIAAHPDDEDTQLIAWLARGRHVETAYLSLTRGDGGQNLIGDELGEGLGVIRSEELLAARRIDGGRQYFSRAYDFGFSKTAAETFEKWPREAVLGDVVRVVRQFRPHVIVSVFSGTPRDGHGHHQVAGILAREAYELAGDTRRFPVAEYGRAWEPAKFYRSARFNRVAATFEVPVGEYDPILGRSFAEVAGASRSQHKSQGFGSLERRGPASTFVAREASRVAAPDDPSAERSLFDGIDTSWTRLRGVVGGAGPRAAFDSLPAAIAAVRAGVDFRDPGASIPALVRVRRLLDTICPVSGGCSGEGEPVARDLQRSHETAVARVNAALLAAAGVAVEAEAARAVVVAGAPVPVVVRVYNQGEAGVIIDDRPLAPASVRVDTVRVEAAAPTAPWWLAEPRRDGVFTRGSPSPEDARVASAATVALTVRLGDAGGAVDIPLDVPVVQRTADAVRGDVSVPVAAAPAIAVTLDRAVAYAPAGREIERVVRVRLRSADPDARVVRVALELPRGLRADSATRELTLASAGAEASVAFTIRGQLAPGRHLVRAVANSGGERFTTGYDLIDYDHIRPQRLYRPAEIAIEAVDVTIPVGLTVAYVRGVSDNVAPMIEELGVALTMLEAGELAGTDLSSFDAVVLGPRVYEASAQIAAATPRLLDYARGGGTLVVQYQQDALNAPTPTGTAAAAAPLAASANVPAGAPREAGAVGAALLTPYALTVPRPIVRVTVEEAPVRIVDPTERLLTWPNTIGERDFAGWVQERSLYMPSVFDPRYRAPLEMNDPGEAPSRGALLIAPYGEGTYIFTTLALFRQLPAGVPGAARLFVNLLSAGARERPAAM